MIKCTLSCQNPNTSTEFNLSDCLVDMSSVDFSKCTAVFEDGSYDIFFVCDQYNRVDIESVAVCVNGEQVGNIVLNTNTTIVEGSIKYRDNILAKQPFLLHYDLIVVSFILSFADGTSKEYFTDFLLCVCKNQDDVINVENMLRELIAFDDPQINEWVFSDRKQDASNGLYKGKWNKHTYKSLSSYIQLLEEVITCYKNNYAYFKMQGKHTIKQSSALVSYAKVKKISRDSFKWIVQNADQLAGIPYSSGIRNQGKNYLPYHIKINASKKSWDVYENRAIISFLYTVLGQFTRNYTQTVKRAADNKRRYAPGWVHSTCLLRGFPKGAAPHLAHDFAEQSVVCYTLCRRCPENTVAAGEGKGI